MHWSSNVKNNLLNQELVNIQCVVKERPSDIKNNPFAQVLISVWGIITFQNCCSLDMWICCTKEKVDNSITYLFYLLL